MRGWVHAWVADEADPGWLAGCIGAVHAWVEGGGCIGAVHAWVEGGCMAGWLAVCVDGSNKST